MNAPNPNRLGAVPPRGNLRPRLALQSLILVFAITTIATLAGILAAKLQWRTDVTTTREHELSPQTKAILAKLNEPLDLVVAAELSALDTLSRRRTLDVVDKFAKGSPNLRTVLIDTASPDGLKQYDDFLRNLAVKSQAAVDTQKATVTAAAQTIEGVAAALPDVGKAIEEIRDMIADTEKAPTLTPKDREVVKQFWNTQAAASRTLTEDVRAAAAKCRQLLEQVIPPMPIPAIDEAARTLAGPTTTTASGLTVLAQAVDQFIANPWSDGPVREKARALGAMLPPLRDAAARAASQLETLPTLPLLTAAKAIQRNRAVLLISGRATSEKAALTKDPRSITALAPDAILPPRVNPQGADPAAPNADDRFRAEQLIASGIAAMISPARPLVVITHAAPAKVGPAYRGVRAIVDTLSLRGIDVTEWATSLDAEPPKVIEPDPANPRPVVYLVMPIEIRTTDDAGRMSKLSQACERLVNIGKPIFLSVNLSTLPGAGAPDPMVEFLKPLGLSVDSGRPLLEETRPLGTPGRDVLRDQLMTDLGSTHPIALAVKGLRVRLPWAISIRRTDPLPAGVSVADVVTVPPKASVWAESEWNARQGIPANDSPRDQASGKDPWSVGVTLERTLKGNARNQRVLVIGSALWIVDSTMQATAGEVDGRKLLDSPGNAELLAAGVAWLAGQDDTIAASPAARAVPLIPNLTDGQRAVLRMVFVIAVPVAILLLGALWRWWRG